MKLNFRTLGDEHTSKTPVIILHGVFGSSDNWQSVGKVLSETRKIYLVDQRNHGLSPHSNEFNYQVMAEDLLELMSDESLNSAHLVGHSMGGKTVMHFACEHPEKVASLIVVDIAPRAYPPHHQEIFRGFHAVDLQNLESRQEADTQMARVINIPAIRQFLLKNLTRDDYGFAWKHNLNAIESNIDRVGIALPKGSRFAGNTLFIAGSKSDYIRVTDEPDIKEHFPKATIKTVQGAGHWVHAEKPKELIELLEEFWDNL